MAQNQQVANKPKPNALTIIETQIKSDDVQKRLMVALDVAPEDEKGQSEVFKYASSVLAEIRSTQGSGEYTDLTLCTPDSICKAMIDAAHFRVQIDGRKLAHLEKRSNKAILQIAANGYVAKIQERYKDFTVKIIHKFKGDKLEISGENGDESYKFESKNPYGTLDDLEGVSVYLQYTNAGGRLIRSMTNASKAELLTIASKSKGKAFSEFWKERMGTAALKRACKWHFRKDATVSAMIEYDNKENFDLENAPQPANPVRPSIIDNINQSLRGEENGERQETPQESSADDNPNIIDVEAEDEENWDEEPEESDSLEFLIKAGDDAASKGKEAYMKFKATWTPEQKELIGQERHKAWLAKIVEAEENPI